MDILSTTLDALMSNNKLLVMWGALFLHWYCPSPSYFNPFIPWRTLADAVEEKVNHNKNGPEQQKTAGLLALILLWGGMLAALVSLKQLFWPPGMDLLLLWLALHGRPLLELTEKVRTALVNNDIPKARQALAGVLNRDTLALSRAEIIKACAETISIGYFRGVFAVLFWYCFCGSVGAFMYALLSALCRFWPTPLVHFNQFGKASSALLAMSEWIPVRLFTLLIVIGKKMHPAFLAFKAQGPTWPQKGNGGLLAALGTKYQFSLGGQISYDTQQKLRPFIGTLLEPSPDHLSILYQRLQTKTFIGACLMSLCLFFYHAFGTV